MLLSHTFITVSFVGFELTLLFIVVDEVMMSEEQAELLAFVEDNVVEEWSIRTGRGGNGSGGGGGGGGGGKRDDGGNCGGGDEHDDETDRGDGDGDDVVERVLLTCWLIIELLFLFIHFFFKPIK